MQLLDYLRAEAIAVPDFAKSIGVTAASVYRYASGDRIPHRPVMQKIKEATGGRVGAEDFYAAAA